MGSDYIQEINAVIQEHSGPPSDCLEDLSSDANPDTNAGFGGKYVYLVPKRTDDWQEAGYFVRVQITDSPIPGGTDLAAGAGGKYRYVSVLHDKNNTQKITKAVLYRKPKSDGAVTPDEAARIGFNRVSEDINRGRGGDYLHVVYAVTDLQ
ncbi:hypothetical protein EYR40_004985 [Pleurotus pulmonarius]|nr:hypothetical protein EYR36_006638 [Pleurotus pulmonarius]KAF4601334.1 hypothetical protein EYR38_005986 [Pleurotus pulmonarius]KAF4601785.1 hypothetical protein EYR40_004985 [Pleurotus pulmonarius]